MQPLKTLSLTLIGLLLCWQASAAQIDVNGIKFDDSIEVRGSKLQLNGAGTRYKAIFKVYAAGLYLTKKASSLDEVVNAPGPKRLSITMLRSIDSRELGKLLTRGMEDNVGSAATSKLLPGMMRMSEIFSEHKSMVPGDNFMIEWVPGSGSVVTVKGKVQGAPFPEPEFFRALMAIWLGPSPADYQLKDALTGKAN